MSTTLNTLISSANIKDSYFGFLSKQEIEIFCPFIKYDTFKSILEHNPKISRVISRWDPYEIVQGASDIEVYKLCKEHGIDFYINKRIHLKATLKARDSVFHSSANLTYRGVNHDKSSQNHNHELSTILKLNGVKDLVLFEEIVQESIFVTDEVYEMMSDFLSKIDYQVNEIDPFPKFEEMKQFYISQLPTSMDINTLFEIYSDRVDNFSETEINCAVHDLAIYKIEEGLDYKMFTEALKKSFFNHPFINGLMVEVESEGFIYFGRVKQWLQDNCQDVPVPKRRELTEVTKVLYKWVEVLGGEKYVIDRPNHSQRIRVNE
jgi:hypothetical protein